MWSALIILLIQLIVHLLYSNGILSIKPINPYSIGNAEA